MKFRTVLAPNRPRHCRPTSGPGPSRRFDNAIKFTPPSGSVEVRLVRSDAADIVSVSDSGAGISEADRTMVLKRLYRAEPSRDEPGSGLGLSLVRAIADLHGASITLEYRHPGLGVIVTFPATKSSAG